MLAVERRANVAVVRRSPGASAGGARRHGYGAAVSRHPDGHIEETNAIATELERAGLVGRYTNADGEPICRLTPQGEMVARQMAMSDESGAAEPLDALLLVSG